MPCFFCGHVTYQTRLSFKKVFKLITIVPTVKKIIIHLFFWNVALSSHYQMHNVSFRSHRHAKVIEQQQHALSFFHVYFLTSEEVLWILIRFLRTPNTDVSVDKPHPWFLALILWQKCGLYMDVYGSSFQCWFRNLTCSQPERLLGSFWNFFSIDALLIPFAFYLNFERGYKQ